MARKIQVPRSTPGLSEESAGERLGELLAGRFASVSVDSVDATQELRDP